MSPVDKILFARRLRISTCFLEACEELVKRKERISDDDAQKLGLLTTSRLYQERERCREEHLPSQRSSLGQTSFSDFLARGTKTDPPSTGPFANFFASLAQTQPSSSAFGSSTRPPIPSPLFGSSTPTQPSSSTSGSSAQPQPPSSTFVSSAQTQPSNSFGPPARAQSTSSTTGSSAQPPSSSFGSPTATQSPSSTAGSSAQPQPPSSSFGSSPRTQPPSSTSGSSAQPLTFGFSSQPRLSSDSSTRTQPSSGLFSEAFRNPSQSSFVPNNACSHLSNLRQLFRSELAEMGDVEEN